MDDRERRLGSILLLAALLGYSLLHTAAMTLFRGQNYLPVVPFSSLVAAWAIVELWRAVTARLAWLAWRPLAAVIWLAVGVALLAQQWTIVYSRVIPTTFELTNAAVRQELDPVGLRQVVYEESLGGFDVGGKPRRPLVTRVPKLSALAPTLLDRADVEIFPQSRLDGPDGAFYRARMAHSPRGQVEIVDDRWFRRRGEPIVILRHPWTLLGDPLDLEVRRPEGDPPFLTARLPEGLAKPGETVSLVFWIPRGSDDDRDEDVLRLDPGGVPVPVADTGRRLNRLFRTSARFTLTGQEQRVRIPSVPNDGPRGYGLELYSWRPAAAPAHP